jgi:hypothetical protein
MMPPQNLAAEPHKIDVSYAVEGGFWASGLAGTARPHWAALQVIRIEPQEIRSVMNETVVRTCPLSARGCCSGVCGPSQRLGAFHLPIAQVHQRRGFVKGLEKI